jgi:dihydroxyacetone kinase-like protein
MTIGPEEFVRMMEGAIQRVKDEHKMLSALDSAAGDGDHGTTMLRAMDQLVALIAGYQRGDLEDLLSKMGWTWMGIDGGATGPLLGSFFIGMSESAAGQPSVDADGFAALFEAGLNAVKKQTRAQVGDKTLMDALIPAVAALRSGAEAKKEIPEMLREAAAAAQQGALSTKDLRARFGRAKYLGDRTLGHQDPGATSISLIFQGFCEGLS